ncbi:AmpG family muropeptide MFS transporter [Sphingomonas oligophenolica]|uniref:MFS transporter n=1 Tax=Sphingomonas oligophenolica TaxID=301154 RepID=A0A502CGL2_9SPHN|nr:MFS transporter [Sphingomonas oligophenolica]TPG12297.1 MFS transporter [Sphingomonas oligophenolica]
MTTAAGTTSWIDGLKPYVEKGPLIAFTLGLSSGFPIAMIGATLTSRLAQDGLTKSTITAFTLGFLVYNLKPLWAWAVDSVKLPLIGGLGQRVSWLLFAGALVVAAVANLAFARPTTDLSGTIIAAVLVGFAGATFDIVIDAYRIEQLKPYQLGVGSGMSQYGYRIGNVGAASLALVLSARFGWAVGYLACAAFVLPAIVTGLVIGEPERHREPVRRRGIGEMVSAVAGPFAEFFRREGAMIILTFILIHKIGDTLANIVLRLMLNDLGFSNDEIAIYDVGVGFWAYLIGVFVGGALYSKLGLKKSVLISLLLMAVSNASFALLAMAGHSNWGLAGTIGFENFTSGIGSVAVVAYFSALCDLRFTAAQYALISAAASVVGRLLTATTAGGLVERFGYVDFYWGTTLIAFPGVLLFWWMSASGLVDRSIGSAGIEGEGDARAGESG